MELRRVLFERRLLQADILNNLPRDCRMKHSALSMCVNGRAGLGPRNRAGVRHALIVLGVPADEAADIWELREARPPRKQRGRRRSAEAAHGEGQR